MARNAGWKSKQRLPTPFLRSEKPQPRPTLFGRQDDSDHDNAGDGRARQTEAGGQRHSGRRGPNHHGPIEPRGSRRRRSMQPTRANSDGGRRGQQGNRQKRRRRQRILQRAGQSPCNNQRRRRAQQRERNGRRLTKKIFWRESDVKAGDMNCRFAVHDPAALTKTTQGTLILANLR